MAKVKQAPSLLQSAPPPRPREVEEFDAGVPSAGESKAERFERLATARMEAALKRIELIGNLAGPGYESTPEQQAAMWKALDDAIAAVKARFQPKKAGGERRFAF